MTTLLKCENSETSPSSTGSSNTIYFEDIENSDSDSEEANTDNDANDHQGLDKAPCGPLGYISDHPFCIKPCQVKCSINIQGFKENNLIQ